MARAKKRPGRPPKPHRDRIVLSLDPALIKNLREQARDQRRSISEQAATIFDAAFNPAR